MVSRRIPLAGPPEALVARATDLARQQAAADLICEAELRAVLALHPGGLPGADELCPISGLKETIEENPSGGALANGRIRAQNCHL